MTASSRQAGAALAAQDAAAGKLGPGVSSMSRPYIEGYGQAAKFEAAVRSVGRALDRGMDPARAAVVLDGIYRRFNQTADAAKLAGEGFKSLAPILNDLNARFDAVAAAQTRVATGTGARGASGTQGAAGINGQAVTQLSFQLNDIATQLASGTGLFQTLAQQGGQVLQVWQQSPSVFGDTARAIGGVLTPARLLGATLIGAGVAGFATYERWQGVLRDTERALLGTGRSAGIASAQIISMADEVARRQGGSAGNARGTLNALANTGRIAPGNLSSIAGLERDLAATLGIELAEANKLLASSFADPVRGADELNKSLGGINTTVRDYIRRLSESGREQEAQIILVERVRDRIGAANELTSFWTRSWQGLTAAASGAADALGRALDAATGGGRTRDQRAASAQAGVVGDLEAQKRIAEDMLRRFERFPEATERWGARLADVTRQLEQARSAMSTMPAVAGIVDPVITARSREDAFAAALRNRQIEAGTVAGRELGAPDRQASENLDRLIRQYDQLLTAKRAFEAEGRRGATFSGPDAEAMTQDYLMERQRERLKITQDLAVAQRAIRDQTSATGLFARDGTIDRNKALEGALTLTQRLNDETRVQRLETTARTAAEREAAAVERARFDARLAGAQAGDGEARRARETNAALLVRTQIEAQLSLAARQRIASANDNITAGRGELANLGASTEMQERNRIVTQMTNEALRERRALYGETAGLPEAEAAAIRRVAAEQASVNNLIRERKALQDLQFERDQMFRSPVEQNVASRARSLYGEGYADQMNGFIANQERMNASMRQFGQIGEQAFSSITDGFIQGRNAGEIFSGVLRSIAGQIAQMAVQGLWRSVAPSLFGSLFGGAAGTGGGLLSFGSGGLYASGAAFSGGNVIPFANGGIVSGPTMFPMSGGRTGLMGEAGEEAIIPLRRGPNGALGVQAHGGGGGGGTALAREPASVSLSVNIDARGATHDAVALLRSQIPGIVLQTVQQARIRGAA
jgi:phage-related minor tail protein